MSSKAEERNSTVMQYSVQEDHHLTHPRLALMDVKMVHETGSVVTEQK